MRDSDVLPATPSTLASLFDGDAVTIEAKTELADDQLYPEERAYLARAVPKRRAEFGTARVCVRRALDVMGIAPMALVPQANRAPVWPAGVVGSITHAHEYCAVVLHRSPPMRSVGIDAEVLRPISPDVARRVVSPSEREWIDAQGSEANPHLALLFFSAKEAYYKCQYPISKTYLGFHDVHLDVDAGSRRFEARAVRPGLPEAVTRLEGKYVFERGMVLCGVELAL